MKRYLLFLLTLMFVLVVCLSTYNMAYANDSVDNETAVELIKNARDIMLSYKVQFQWFADDPDIDGPNDKRNDISVENFNGWNMISYFRPVGDGFDAEGVKKLIFDTFVKPVAENYINQERFYDLYYTNEEKLYYYISYGAQLGDFSSLELSDEEIENLSLVGTGMAAVKTRFQLPFNDYHNGEVTVFFSFEKESDVWKISEMNASECLFKSYGKEYDLSSFSKDVAKTEIRALLGEVYRLAHVDGGEFVYYLSIDDTNYGGKTRIDRFGHAYYRINGIEGKTETWLSYASRFASEEIAIKLVQNGLYCVSENGRMYYRERHSADNAFAENYFRSEIFDDMELEIVSQTDSRAFIKAKLPAIDQQEVDLSFEFMRIDDQWKISGGNFIEMLDAIYLAEEANPSTGDNGSLVFAPIVTIGMLIGIIYQKKRYSEFLN